MIALPISTPLVEAGKQILTSVLDEALTDFKDGSVLAITSKVIALCENRVVKVEEGNKDELIKQESSYFLSREGHPFGFSFTITNNTLIPAAGIDESNTGGYYVLWPKNSQDTANQVRKYLVERFGVKKVGVIITDSSVAVPLRWGTIGIVLSYSGFKATKDYRGQPDLFGRPFQVSQSAIAGSLATTAVLVMGEGTEQTPLAVISEIPFVEFQDHDPTEEELKNFSIGNKDEDIFAPFLNGVNWQKGDKS